MIALFYFIVARCWRTSTLSRTDTKEAQENMLLAQSILNSSKLRYNTYKIKGHGVVTCDTKRGRTIIGIKSSHMRRPSAYKGQKGQVSSFLKITALAYTGYTRNNLCTVYATCIRES